MKIGHASGPGARLFEPQRGELRDRILQTTGNLSHGVLFAVSGWALDDMSPTPALPISLPDVNAEIE